MAFINLIPREKEYVDSEHNYRIDAEIPLRVVRDDGVEMSPDVNIKVTDLSKGQKQFVNASGKGDKYSITVLVHEDDTFTGTWTKWFNPSYGPGPGGRIIVTDHFDYPTTLKVTDLLDWCIRSMKIVLLTSDDEKALIPNGDYIITDNPHRTQNFKDGYSLWELEFTKYTDTVASKYNYVTAAATKAINAYNKKKSTKTTKKSNTTTKAKQSSTLNSQLKKCKVSQMKYSKTKKVTSCVKTLQKYLNKKGKGNLAVDGWYGNATLKAVKKFQTDFKKKYKLNKPNGKMDSKTLNAMVKE